MSGNPVATIGLLEGSPDYMFGETTDAAFGPTGDIVVLDSKYGNFREYSPAGVLEAKGGSPGTGPGEFLDAQSLAVDATGTVYVGDLDLAIERFVRDLNGVRYDTAFKVGVEPKDLCVMNGLLYVHGTSMLMDGLVQVFDPHGTRKSVFGSLYKSGSPIIDYKANLGRIACSPDLDMVFYTPGGLLGEVRAFRGDGTPIWRTDIEGFKPVSLTSNSRGGSTVIIPEQGFHRAESIAFRPPNSVVLQIAFVTRASLQKKLAFESIATLVLNAHDGSLVETWDVAESIAALSPGALLTASSDPFPQLRLRRW